MLLTHYSNSYYLGNNSYIQDVRQENNTIIYKMLLRHSLL